MQGNCPKQRYKQALIKSAASLYGLNLSMADYATLCSLIREGEGECIGRSSSRVTIWRLYINDKQIVVEYNKRNGYITKAVPDPNTQKLAS